MIPDGRTDGMDGRTHGRRQNYIPPTSSGDNNRQRINNNITTAKFEELIAYKCNLGRNYLKQIFKNET